MAFPGIVNRHQADVIAYLVEENRILEEQVKGRKLRLTDDQRRRLAAKAKILERTERYRLSVAFAFPSSDLPAMNSSILPRRIWTRGVSWNHGMRIRSAMLT